MDDTQYQLLVEQLGRMKDGISSRITALETELHHQRELNAKVETAITDELAEVRKLLDDHESRIRTATDGVTSFKVTSGLANGGASVMSLIALVKSFLGGP